MIAYKRIKVRSALTKSSLPDLDYALNPYIGCYHACKYCYARGYVGKFLDAGINWGEVVYIKENLVDVLRDEVKKLKIGVVGISTITDPYQPIEVEELIVRRSLNVLLNAGFRVSIQTKSNFIVRDLDILRRFKYKVDVGFTITSIDDELMMALEPRSPPPSARIRAIKRVADEGIETWIFYGPVIPYINDSPKTIGEILKLAKETNSKVLIDKLHLRPWIIKSLNTTLSKVLDKERALKVLNTDFVNRWWKLFKNKVLSLCRAQNITCYAQITEPVPKTSKSLLDYT